MYIPFFGSPVLDTLLRFFFSSATDNFDMYKISVSLVLTFALWFFATNHFLVYLVLNPHKDVNSCGDKDVTLRFRYREREKFP